MATRDCFTGQQLLNVCEKNDYFPSGGFDQNSLTDVIFLINTR